MTNKKISALTGATTPLAGTEVLPIVQSGATVKVAVSDLTAGRAIATQNITTTSGRVQINFDGSAGAPMFDLRNSSGTQWELYTPTSDNSLKLDVWVPGQRDSVFSIQNTAGSHNITVSTGNLVFGTAAKGINFTANTPAAGMTSQLLNWYEEGTYTVAATCDSGTITLAANNTRYTRIGRVIHAHGQLTASSVSSPTGNVRFTLPFSSALSSSVTLYMASTTALTGVIPVGLINSGQSSFYIQLLNQISGNISGAANIFQANTYFNFQATYTV